MNESELVHVVMHNVRKGVASVRGCVSSIELRRLMTKVIKARPRDLEGYAFMVGRNGAISAARREAAQQRQVQREWREYSEAIRQWREAQQRQVAREQFTPFVRSLNVGHALTHREQLEMVRLQVIEGCRGEELVAAFPGVTPAQRWQWKRRGVKLLLRHNPPAELRRVLEASIGTL